MLHLIWTVSLVMSAVAVAATLVLVVIRFFRDRGEDRDVLARKALFAALIRFTEDDDEAALHAVLIETPPRVMAHSGFEFTGLLRGEDELRVERAFARAGLADYVRERLRKGGEAERIYCTEMLTAFPGEETVKSLFKALEDDPAREVQIAAALALVRLDSAPAIGNILGRIGSQGHRSRRLVDLFRTLGETNSAELRAFVAHGKGPDFLRAAAVEAMSAIADYRLIELFERLARDASAEVSAASIRVLARHGRPESASAVLEGLQRQDWEIRSEAADAAGRLGLAEALPDLERLLSDEEWTVRYAAGKALQNLGAEGRALLEEAAAGFSSRRQRTASMILAEDLAA